jgi:hypothetical protein
MSTGYFAVLNDSSSDEEDTTPERLQQTPQRQTRKRSTSISIREEASEAGQVQIPSYEDLTTTRTDEVTVLQAVYGQEFQQNGPFEFLVNVRPPDIEAERIGSHLT